MTSAGNHADSVSTLGRLQSNSPIRRVTARDRDHKRRSLLDASSITPQLIMNKHSLRFLWLAFALVLQPTEGSSAQYAPLKTLFEVEVVDTSFSYGPSNRSVPLRIYLPKTDAPNPVLLFSHGLGGSREASPFLGKHWSGRGYCVVFMQHAGSDRDVMKNAGRFQRLSALKNAISGESANDRKNDVRATIDELEKLTLTRGQFYGKLDLDRLGMSGHSFGAITTQAVSGQEHRLKRQTHKDSRIKAAIAMSPSMPPLGGASSAFASIKIPWLLMTGTDDNSPVNRRVDAKSRREVFKALPSDGHSFELVLNEGTHFIFGGRSDRLPASKKSKLQQETIKAISTAFWDAYLMEAPAALAWLNGGEVRTILDDRDTWSKK